MNLNRAKFAVANIFMSFLEKEQILIGCIVAIMIVWLWDQWS